MEKSESSSANPRPWQSYNTVYTNAKAGMDGVDKEKIQRIVYEMSKGSKYFENEERKEEITRQKIEHMCAQCAKLTTADISHYQKVADKRILELEATRDLSRIWLHVDMDAFFAAVETLSNPSLKGKPMAVGGLSMISTANYEARRFGVRAAMPGFIARKLCPDLIFVPPDFKKYTYYGDLTRKVFQKYDPNFMAASLDEAYLDITEVCKERGIGSGEIAEELRASVYCQTGLTCSAGVAPNRLLAKVCSDINKPNGQFVLPNDRMAVMTFISSLPIRKIGGIGKVTEHILKDVFEINTCEEMVQKGSFLCALFSHSSADFFLSVGLGLGKTDAPEIKFRKSISNERTFSATDDEAVLYKKLADLAEMLSADMQKEGLCGRTLTLKLKTAAFEVRTRAVTLQTYICSSEDILKHGSKLLKAELPVSIRLIGLRVSHFDDDKVGTSSDPTQKTLTNFIISGDASRKNTGDQCSLRSDTSNNQFMNDTNETRSVWSTDRNGLCHFEFRVPFKTSHLTERENNNYTFNNNVGDAENVHEPSHNHQTEDKVSSPQTVGHSLCVQNRVTLLEADSFASRHLVCENLDRPDEEVNIRDGVDVSSSLFWVDDYKCSLCGIELPPSFIEERQEHSDFHFAERLQQEESATNSTTLLPRQRFERKDDVVSPSQSKRKKQKPSPKENRHIPIDRFFVKSNQNF